LKAELPDAIKLFSVFMFPVLQTEQKNKTFLKGRIKQEKWPTSKMFSDMGCKFIAN
jgi:hypothetical protein